jgi:hypothetical protein
MAAGFVSAVCVGFWPQPAGAVDGMAAGSWWTGQNDGNNVPAPPTVTPGGLWVQYGGSTTTAYSALKFTLADDERAPVISLQVHSPNQTTSQAVIQACPAKGDWQPATAGPMSAAPQANCSAGSVQGALNADSTIMTFDLSSLADGKSVNVVFLPAPAIVAPPSAPVPTPAPPGLPVTPPVTTPPPSTTAFDLVFEVPTPQNVAVTVDPQPTTDEALPSPAYSPPTAADTPTAVYGPLDVAPPSSGTPAPLPAATPAVRRLVPVRHALPQVSKNTRNVGRALAGATFLALAAWMARDAFSSTGGGGTGVGPRFRMTLYDSPPTAVVEAARQTREGKPLPLR